MPNNKLKKITTVAKQLYKSGKFAKWTDAIRAASKQISGTKTHKDTKSHNVNIRVVSGIPTTLNSFAKQQNLKVATLNYGGQKGYALVDNQQNEIVEIQPINRSNEKWLVSIKGADYTYKKNMAGVITYLKKNIEYVKPRFTGYKFIGKVGAVKIIQKGQSKNAKVTKVLQQVRTKAGTFKGYKQISGLQNVSAGAKKLWLEINKKGLFKYNTEENILRFLYDEALRKGQFKKAEYLNELLNDVVY